MRLLTVEGQESRFQGESGRRSHGQERKDLGELGGLTSVLSNCGSQFHSYPDEFILNVTPLINKSYKWVGRDCPPVTCDSLPPQRM